MDLLFGFLQAMASRQYDYKSEKYSADLHNWQFLLSGLRQYIVGIGHALLRVSGTAVCGPCVDGMVPRHHTARAVAFCGGTKRVLCRLVYRVLSMPCLAHSRTGALLDGPRALDRATLTRKENELKKPVNYESTVLSSDLEFRGLGRANERVREKSGIAHWPEGIWMTEPYQINRAQRCRNWRVRPACSVL